MNKQRPKHFDLHLIQLPLPGFVSMLHRTFGWISQWNQMMVGRDHQIGRPRQLYIGATRRDYAAAGQR
ncbi:MAG: hypothetical protein HYS19_02650 [Nitrosomonadales bacterium]|nr:hypothetical protein [Nitrosomonadales bacterium]